MSRTTRTAAALGLALGLLAAAAGARAGDGEAIDAKAAFARLKAMAGEWRNEGGRGHGAGAKVSYRVTAAGSAVMETLFAGTDHEMVSMYHMDGDDLRMTHYCAVGNQPRMKLDRARSRPDRLEFAFDGGTNLDPAKDLHIHAGRITFLDGGKVECEWDAHKGGEKVESARFSLSRP